MEQSAFEARIRQLTRELDEAREEQRATSAILRVLATSRTDAQPVFDMIAQSAAKLFGAQFCLVFRFDGELLHFVAYDGVSSAGLEALRRAWPRAPDRGTAAGRATLSGQIEEIPDVHRDSDYKLGIVADAVTFRSTMAVPMLHKGSVIGVITISRSQPGRFLDSQIELLQTFADQAVIAIENLRQFEELQEALEYQTATSEVLNVISRAPSELEPVFGAIVDTAARLCQADYAVVHRLRDGAYHVAAANNAEADYVKYLRNHPMLPDRGSVVGRTAVEGRTVHLPDCFADPEYTGLGYQVAGGFRTILGVPLLRERVTIGVITMLRNAIRPFTEKQIELVETFADQAVIAIENVRLFEEVQARTRDLSEALEQQTASSEVLGVISRSLGQIEPVFQTMLANAMRICEAQCGVMFSFARGMFRATSCLDVEPEFERFLREERVWGPHTGMGRMVHTKQPVHILDALADRAFDERDPGRMAAVHLGGLRTFLIVPMLKDGELIGAMSLYRHEVRAYTDKQIDLVSTFADQAVIAIENARLFEEVQSRTAELQESLEYQTATSEVLEVISQSPTDAEPVFKAIVQSAARLCCAVLSNVQLYDGELLHIGATHNFTSDALEAFLRMYPRKPDRSQLAGRAILSRNIVHVHDVLSDPDYAHEIAVAGNLRAMLSVPMFRDGNPVGVITVVRREAAPFSERQIELLKTFADQAVIAIGNVRLFDEVQARTRELQESLEYQTATSDVLSVISRSPSQIQPVLDTIAETAGRLCEGYDVLIRLREGDLLKAAAHRGPIAIDTGDRPVGRGWAMGRAVVDRKPVHVHDLRTAAAEFPDGQAMARRLGVRTMLVTPLMRENEAIGAIAVRRAEMRPFSDKQVAILQTFADQAVIAIENARLFEEVQARTRELARSVSELQALSEVSHAVNSTLDLETVLNTIVAKAVQLSGTDAGAIYVFSNLRQKFRLRATYGMSQELIEAISRQHIGSERQILSHAQPQQRAAVQVPDLTAVPSTPVQDIILKAGYRALLVVPLLRLGRIVGALVVRRRSPGEFPKSTIDLLQTFAAQSVLAIQNARLFSEIEEKSRALQIASQHKSQFLANMSHELRTPLNAIIGLTEMLREEAEGPEFAGFTEPLDRVHRAGKHLLGLINDVLDLSKIEAGKVELHEEDFDLAMLARDLVVTAQPLADKNGNRLALEFALGAAPMHGDQMRLGQVLLNLLSNACKFTENGTVTLRYRGSRGKARLSGIR